MKKTIDMTPQETILIGHDHRYRVWDGERMHYEPDIPMESRAPMWITGWQDSSGKDMYEGDVVRDCDGYRGVIVWWREECCFALKLPETTYQILALAEYCPGDLTVLGNVYEHPDWANWDEIP